MRRRLILVGVLAMALAACGGSSPSPSASGATTSSPAPQASGSAGSTASAAPSEAASASQSTDPSAAIAVCDGIGVRKQPSSSGARVASILSGTEVHVLETVKGTAYTVGTCGVSGNTWLKVDVVGGKTTKAAYGLPFVYVAAGFFQ